MSEFFEASLARPFGLGLGRRDQKCVIKDVVPGGNGERAGFLKGDLIVRMNDYQGESYDDFMGYMSHQPKHLSTQIVVQREVHGKDLGLQAIVSGAMNVFKNGNRYAVYRLAIRDKSRTVWMAHKRYTDFEELHKSVGKAIGAALPGKTLFGKNDENVIKARMVSLNDYLAAMLASPVAVEHPTLAAFLQRDQPLIGEEHVVDSWDADWAGAFLGKEAEPARDSMSSLRRKVMMESGKKSAVLLGKAAEELSGEERHMDQMEAQKSDLHSKLLEVSSDLQVKITEAEARREAMQDLVAAISTYEDKIAGEHAKCASQHKTNNKKLAGKAVPKKRLLGEVTDITAKIESTKEGLDKLKEMKVETDEEGKMTEQAMQMEIDQAARERGSQERLLDNIKAHLTRMNKEVDETNSALDELNGDSQSMNDYFAKMEAEAADVKEGMDTEEANLRQLEEDEKNLLAEQESTQEEHSVGLQELEALLGALKECGDLRDTHAASLRGLKQMTQGDSSLSELADQELARIQSQAATEQLQKEEASSKRETTLHAIKESDTHYAGALREIRSKITAQRQTIERLADYSTQVNQELEFATEQLRKHNLERASLEECTAVLRAEVDNISAQESTISKVVETKKKEETNKKQALELEQVELQGRVTDISEQTDAEQQVLDGLEEFLARTKTQLADMDGPQDQKGQEKLVEQCEATFSEELNAVKTESETRKAELAELEQAEEDLKKELSDESARLAKEERDMAYKIEVDSRAMGLKQGYANKLSTDVKISGATVPARPSMTGRSPKASERPSSTSVSSIKDEDLERVE